MPILLEILSSLVHMLNLVITIIKAIDDFSRLKLSDSKEIVIEMSFSIPYLIQKQVMTHMITVTTIVIILWKFSLNLLIMGKI